MILQKMNHKINLKITATLNLFNLMMMKIGMIIKIIIKMIINKMSYKKYKVVMMIRIIKMKVFRARKMKFNLMMIFNGMKNLNNKKNKLINKYWLNNWNKKNQNQKKLNKVFINKLVNVPIHIEQQIVKKYVNQ